MGNNGKTLAETVAEQLLQTIHDKGLSAGERLPTEKELQQELNVGRNTLREALKILVSRNIVTIRQGSGTFISQKPGVVDDPFGFSMINDREQLTRDLLQVRLMIEPPIAALAAQCATEHDIRELQEILEEMEKVLNRREDYSTLDIAFHQRIARSTQNRVMENLVPVIGKGIAIFATAVRQTEYEQTLISHRKIFHCIQRHQSFEAEMEMRFHLLYNNNRYDIEQK